MRKNILITGGAGFIGINLVKHLVENTDHTMLVVDRSEENQKRLTSVIGKNTRVIQVTEGYEDVNIDAVNYDTVVHLAAVPRILFSVENPVYTNDENLTKMVKFLSNIKEKCPRFIFASSSSVYGDTENYPTKEDNSLLPKSPYSLQKKTGEEYLRIFSDLYGLDVVSLRFFTVFGPHQYVDSDYATVIARWIDQIRKDKNITLDGDGTQVRDFTYIDNVVSAIRIMIELEDSEFPNKESFNVGNQTETSLNELIIMLKDKDTFTVTGGDRRPADVNKTHADISKIREYGYNPMVSVKEGLDRTWKWWTQNNV